MKNQRNDIKKAVRFSNGDIKLAYLTASKQAKEIRCKNVDPDLEYCKSMYRTDSPYDINQTVEMLICVRQLCSILGIENWKSFRSPPEAVAALATYMIWPSNRVSINRCFHGREIDVVIHDEFYRFNIFLDIQGAVTHSAARDEEKRSYFAQKGINLLQIPGKSVCKDFWGFCRLLSEKIKEEYDKIENVVFLGSEHRIKIREKRN